MSADPNTGHRRSIRLPNYDYSAAGAYFVTVCVQQAEMLLGEVRDGAVVLNEWGRLVDDFWADVARHLEDVAVDCHVTMPNHVHAVMVLVDHGRRDPRWDGGTSGGGVKGGEEGGETPPLRGLGVSRRGEVASPFPHDSTPSSDASTLGQVVAYYKYQTTKSINVLRGMPGVRFWQRSYWEHVIRNEADFVRIREYVAANSAHWADDGLRPEAAAKWLSPRAKHHG